MEAGRQSTKKLNPEEMMKKAGGDLKGGSARRAEPRGVSCDSIFQRHTVCP